MEHGMESGCRDGKSRVFDKDNNLISVDGENVQKKKEPVKAQVKPNPEPAASKGGK